MNAYYAKTVLVSLARNREAAFRAKNLTVSLPTLEEVWGCAYREINVLGLFSH
jgi:hypothetical protein